MIVYCKIFKAYESRKSSFVFFSSFYRMEPEKDPLHLEPKTHPKILHGVFSVFYWIPESLLCPRLWFRTYPLSGRPKYQNIGSLSGRNLQRLCRRKCLFLLIFLIFIEAIKNISSERLITKTMIFSWKLWWFYTRAFI